MLLLAFFIVNPCFVKNKKVERNRSKLTPQKVGFGGVKRWLGHKAYSNQASFLPYV